MIDLTKIHEAVREVRALEAAGVSSVWERMALYRDMLRRIVDESATSVAPAVTLAKFNALGRAALKAEEAAVERLKKEAAAEKGGSVPRLQLQQPRTKGRSPKK